MSPAPSRTVTPVAPARVRAHASDVSKRFNAEASTIIRAANLSPYEIVARQGHADADALDRADETLTSDIQVGLHWPDGRPSSESARMIRTLDADLAAWRTALWSTLNGYAVRDMNAAAGQYALARGDGRQACPAVEGLLKSRPSDPAGRAGFESASTWLNRLDDAWQACDAAAAR